MSKFKKMLLYICTTLLIAQSVLPVNFFTSVTKAASRYDEPILNDLMNRPYPRLMANQWSINSPGAILNTSIKNPNDFIATYIDYISINNVTPDSVRGSVSRKKVVEPTPTPTSTPAPTSRIPIPPSNLTVTGVTHQTNYFVYLTWTDNSNNETGFELYQSINSTNSWKLIKTPITNCTNYGVNIGANPTLGTYYYKIRAMNGSLASYYSNVTSCVIN